VDERKDLNGGGGLGQDHNTSAWGKGGRGTNMGDAGKQVFEIGVKTLWAGPYWKTGEEDERGGTAFFTTKATSRRS